MTSTIAESASKIDTFSWVIASAAKCSRLFRIPYANVFYEHFRTSHKAEILVNPLNAFALAY